MIHHRLGAAGILIGALLAGDTARALAQAAHGAGLAGSGTDWAPLSAPVGGRHAMAGPWMMMLHGVASVTASRERGPRGDDAVYSTNFAMASASRAAGRGEFGVRAMASLEPAMGARGYPLLLQTGESADGITPLYDRQHPHDLLMEFAAMYTRPLEQDLDVFVYAGPVGSPAFGPVPFMHRGSADGLLRAPISHHAQDAAHITNGVVTTGVVSERRLKLELSFFNGLEPDHRRWNLEGVRLDSYAFRVTGRAGADWTMQASVAQATSPERLHPGIDVNRLSASVTYNRPLSDGNWQTTIAFGRSKTKRTTIPVPEARRRFSEPVLQHYLALIGETGIPEDSLLLFFPERSQPALLVESSLRIGGWTIAARAERASKTELFPPADARHSQLYDVIRGEVAMVRELLATPFGDLDLGVAGGVPILPAALRSEYGSAGLSGSVFARYTVH